MKKLSFILVLALVLGVIMPLTASADQGKVAAGVSNFFGGLGRTVMCAPKLVARAAVDTIDACKIKKPVDVVMLAPRLGKSLVHDARQESADAVESAVRAVALQEPVELYDVGSANAKVTEMGVDWLADTVFGAAVSGVLVHDAMETSAISHHQLPGKVAFWSAVGIAGSNVAVNCVEK